MLSKRAAAFVDTKVSKHVFGGKFVGLPLSHNVMPTQCWIYNEDFDGMIQYDGCLFRFVKFVTLPTPEEAETLEWRTVDLMNNFGYSNISIDDEIGQLAQALQSQELQLNTMKEFTSKNGNAETKRV